MTEYLVSQVNGFGHMKCEYTNGVDSTWALVLGP